GCGGSCGGCAAGDVCGPTGECVDADSPCEDGNVCTQDWLIPGMGCQNSHVAAPGCSATIEITQPARGAMIQGGGDVLVTGSVKLAGGTLDQVTVNGVPVQPALGSGAFSLTVSPEVGLNVIEVRATSIIGGEQIAVRSFTWASDYHDVGASLTNGTALRTSPEVWDDNDLWDVDDVATVVTLILEDQDLEEMIPNPLGEYSMAWCTYTIEMTEFSLGAPQVELTPVDGSLRAVVTYPDLEVHLHADGSGFGCVGASPKVTADSLQVALYLSSTTQANGWVDVTMENEEAVIDNLDIKLSGVAGFLFNWIINFFEDDVTEAFEGQIVEQLSMFPELLAVAMQQIGYSTTLPLSLPMGPPTDLALDAELGEITFTESGGTFGVATAVAPTNNVSPYPALGSIARGNCGGGANTFSFDDDGPIQFAISDDVV
ncbi:MAG: hypothetical protein VX938_00065, partial [Myxococcota bacterium]|nr:hypothetical protein [Myxococcota bacterium]